MSHVNLSLDSCMWIISWPSIICLKIIPLSSNCLEIFVRNQLTMDGFSLWLAVSSPGRERASQDMSVMESWSERMLVPLSGEWSEKRESSSIVSVWTAEEALGSNGTVLRSLQRCLQVLLLKASKTTVLWELGSWVWDQSRVFLSQETLKLKYRSCWRAWVWKVKEGEGCGLSVTLERGWMMDIEGEEMKRGADEPWPYALRWSRSPGFRSCKKRPLGKIMRKIWSSMSTFSLREIEKVSREGKRVSKCCEVSIE